MLLPQSLIPNRAFIHLTLRRMVRNYYEVLGVKKTAGEVEIKRAYYELAKKYHPDVNSEPYATDKFRELAKAYEVLADPRRRSEYDQLETTGSQRRRGYNFGQQGSTQKETDEWLRRQGYNSGQQGSAQKETDEWRRRQGYNSGQQAYAQRQASASDREAMWEAMWAAFRTATSSSPYTRVFYASRIIFNFGERRQQMHRRRRWARVIDVIQLLVLGFILYDHFKESFEEAKRRVKRK